MADVSSLVGPVLDASEVGRAVLAAILERHPRAVVLDRGAYLRVQVPARCSFARAAVEQRLNRAFVLPADLEAVMPSFSGRFHVSEEEAAWTAAGPP